MPLKNSQTNCFLQRQKQSQQHHNRLAVRLRPHKDYHATLINALIQRETTPPQTTRLSISHDGDHDSTMKHLIKYLHNNKRKPK